MQTLRRTVGLVLVLAAVSAHAEGPGRGGHGKQKDRGTDDQCGRALIVEAPDHTEKRYDPPANLFEALGATTIDQGEQPRPAISLDAFLGLQHASWVAVKDCEGGTQQLPTGLPAEGSYYFVLTGRGSVKVVREVRPGEYVNTIQRVSRLNFRAGSANPKK
jgi:hypothetical protein